MYKNPGGGAGPPASRCRRSCLRPYHHFQKVVMKLPFHNYKSNSFV